MVESAHKTTASFFQQAQIVLHTCLALIFLSFALCGETAYSGALCVVQDDKASDTPIAERAGATPYLPVDGPAVRPEPIAESSPEDKAAEELAGRRDAQLKLFAPMVAEEDALMRKAVRILDREAAALWLGGFISRRPLNCPPAEQAAWIEAILSAVERNDLPLCKEMLGLVATIISIESSFRVDPPAVDSSRGETMAGLLDRAEAELREKFGAVMAVPPVPQLCGVYKRKYYPRLAACRTEGEIEAVAKEVARDLKKDTAKFPAVIQNLICKEIDKVANVVRTKGSMQLSFLRARQVMTERGERFTDEELSDYMYTLQGGVDVGVAALKPMFVQYAARYATPGDLSWLFLVGMDYHYGPFSSRNMMEQIRIRDLSGRKIALDGDFIHYDDKGRPQSRESETLQAASAACPSMDKTAILDAFLLDKDPQYIYTEIHAILAETHRHKFGETPFAVVGDLRMNESAQIKHGTSWKTQAYLRKLDRYLNSIPWD